MSIFASKANHPVNVVRFARATTPNPCSIAPADEHHWTQEKRTRGFRLGALLILMMNGLSGCGVFEYLWLVPRAHENISFDPALTNAEILTAVERTTLAVKVHSYSETQVTRRDDAKGFIELGPYRQSNVTGYAFRAEIDRGEHLVKLVVKGAGPYYSDLPVDDVARELAQQLSQTIGKTSRHRVSNQPN